MSKITRKVPVEVTNRSGYNCDHTNSFTAHCGAITPCLVDHIPANTNVSLDCACEVELPPAISDFFGTIEGRMEFFYVPYRTIWAGWKYFFMQPPQGGNNLIPSNRPTRIQVKYLPALKPSVIDNSNFGRGTLADMLGFKMQQGTFSYSGVTLPNILPFVAYHRIYDEFYRDKRLTQPMFLPPQNGNMATTTSWTNLPWVIGYGSATAAYTYEVDKSDALFQFHQRCWDKDYFTNATTMPQAGDASSVEFNVIDTNTDEETMGSFEEAELKGKFTISSLRIANSLQRFAEINNLVGEDHAEQQFVRFGCYPSDSVTDRPIYLGQKRFNIYKRTVYQQGENSIIGGTTPFSGILGNKTSALSGYGEGFLGKFHAKDPGLLFVMFTLVPRATYTTGARRYLFYEKLVDFPEPLLQGTGDQPVYKYELAGIGDSTLMGETFGYTQRFAEIKFMNDEVHGLLADGQNQSMFQLQRSFDPDNAPDLGTAFVEIPRDYLDQIMVADANVSQFGCRVHIFHKYRKVMPFSAYSLPTLGEPKDTHTVLANVGGNRL